MRRIFIAAILGVAWFSVAGAQPQRVEIVDRSTLGDTPANIQSNSSAGLIPVESFEGDFLPEGWAKITNFGGVGWQKLAAGEPVPGFPDSAVANTPAGGGNAIAVASWATGDSDSSFITGQATDQWLITPLINDVQVGDSLIFYLRYFSRFNDNLDILLSTTDRDSIDSFTIELATLSFVGEGNNEWQRYAFSLSDSVEVGADIYVALRERVSNTARFGDALLLDLVEVASLVTSARDRAQVPRAVELEQNYPNPFNPTTRISFSLPKTTVVTLTVHNLIGQEVAVLARDRVFSAGAHSVDFDGTGLANGVYFYRIQADGLSQVRRMMLLQ